MSERHVVVGIDGSIISTRAQDAAVEEAVRRSVPLEIVYAVPDLDVAGPLLATSAARVRTRHPELKVRLSAVAADPAEALARKGERAALTVVGTRALGGLASLASRSVARRVVERTRCPLLVVGAGHLPYHARTGDVLLAVETDADIESAVFAHEEAARRGVRLRLVHTPLYGPPVRSVDSLIAATADACVVVIAHHPHGNGHGNGGAHHGQTAHALMYRSRCPVFVVPAGLGAL
ncbi:universal stress protein [Streptomyces sp. NPDC059743]|uniref:universal stress protein n=1 Tax=Streptomyces sp. NPDC059743 TaxID=3346928 RepID=UPI0036503EDD